MPNRIESTYIIRRDPITDVIAGVCWYVQNLCNQNLAEKFQPCDAVYLNEAFGEGTPQVLNFMFADDEFALYMDSDSDLAHEVYKFLEETGHVSIVSTVQNAKNVTKWENKEWTIPVTTFPDYMNMVDEMAGLSSQAAIRV